MVVTVERVYDHPAGGAGRRVLVDRLWPRGVRKDAAPWEDWHPDVAPSTELRRWFRHDPARFAEFRARYLAELRAAPGRAALDRLRARGGGDGGALALLTATADRTHNAAEVLREVLSGAADS